MFKRVNKVLIAILFSMLIISNGCVYINNGSESRNDNSETSEQIQNDNSVNDNTDDSIDYVDSEQTIDISSEQSEEISTDDDYISDDTEESDDNINVESSEEFQEESSDVSDESSYMDTPDESSAAQVSYDGYQFDDEQIVDDYHTATVFTSNDTFNEIFSNNALDNEYNSEQQNAGTSSEMRQITASYSTKWKNKVDEIFGELDSILEENPEEHEKLIQSQDEWTSSLPEVESSFYSESGDGMGTEGLIAAEAAVMNYYKGRAAILLEQIYELNGEIDLAQYGL